MTTARDLMSAKFVRIGEDHTAAEAIGIMFDPAASALREIVIVVLDANGDCLGIVEPHDIIESLGAELAGAGDDPAAQIAAFRRGLSNPVSAIARRNLATVRLEDNLATLLLAATRTEAAMLPVLDGKTFSGVIPVTAIFEAVCKISLSAEGENLPFMQA